MMYSASDQHDPEDDPNPVLYMISPLLCTSSIIWFGLSIPHSTGGLLPYIFNTALHVSYHEIDSCVTTTILYTDLPHT